VKKAMRPYDDSAALAVAPATRDGSAIVMVYPRGVSSNFQAFVPVYVHVSTVLSVTILKLRGHMHSERDPFIVRSKLLA